MHSMWERIMSILKRPQTEKYQTVFVNDALELINQFGIYEFRVIEYKGNSVKVESTSKNVSGRTTRICIKNKDIIWEGAHYEKRK